MHYIYLLVSWNIIITNTNYVAVLWKLASLSIFFTLTLFHSSAQKQTNHWFFSSYNGLDFSSGSPVPETGGQVTAMEGGSAISDQNGSLLFYTDGMKVWNRQHRIMPNGTGLHGGYSSATQSAIIVPKPASNQEYYLFTVDEEGGINGLKYSVINMRLENGLGDVSSKNNDLIAPTSEKVTAVQHCNGKDVWVVTHGYGSNAYYAFLVSESGVSKVPVVSNTGTFIPKEYYVMAGQLKASPDGKKLAAAHSILGVELLNFDNATGVVSNPIKVYGENAFAYGVEFSPNSSLLYISVTGQWNQSELKRVQYVFQFDVSLPIAQIEVSKYQVARIENVQELGGLQIGPDQKIYMANYRQYFLSAVKSPNTKGADCNFVQQAVFFDKEVVFGLPNFFVPKEYIKEAFTYSGSPGLCVDDTINFNYSTGASNVALKWIFDDPASGLENESFKQNPSHVFSNPGTYRVALIKYSSCGNDTLRQSLTIGDLQVNLGGDTTYCGTQTRVLDPKMAGSYKYLWQDASKGPTYTAIGPGLYWVEVQDSQNGCTKRDSITIYAKPIPTVSLGNDMALCKNELLQLNAQNEGDQYLWQDGSTGQAFTVKAPGFYWVAVTKAQCTAADTINVKPLTKPVVSLGADQLLCLGQSLQLRAIAGADSYVWQNGSTGASFTVTGEGVYFVDVSNKCGHTKDTIVIYKGSCTVYVPNAFTPDGNGVNDYFMALGTGSVSEYYLQVYNRWGEVVFKTDDKSKGWDGKSKGMDAPTGAYVYIVGYKETGDAKFKTIKGTVLLIR